ncbi:MAG: lipopolysaccharide transport periplasmic protein LptA [Burkholderiaceae bacterium]|nr:lipopolysaccharide transport periplasmic protein LptA [Burkholderiaceae bacterium]
MPRAALLLAAAASLLLAGAAHAERADRTQPMNIASDALRYEDKSQTSTFTGNVVVSKGTIVLRGARLEVRRDAQGNSFGVMQGGGSGKRAFFRQKREGLDEFIEGEGERIEYDGKSDTVRFLNRAEMRRLAGGQLQDRITGNRISYNNVTEVYTVDGAARPSGGGERVHAMLAPRGDGDAASSPASAPALPLRASGQLSGASAP